MVLGQTTALPLRHRAKNAVKIQDPDALSPALRGKSRLGQTVTLLLGYRAILQDGAGTDHSPTL